MVVIPASIVIGVTGGVFTVTESAAVAALYALLYTLIRGWLKGRIPWASVFHAFRKTAMDTSVVLILIGVSHFLTWVITVSQMPQTLVGWVGDFGYTGTLLAINVFLLLLGTFLEPAPAIILATTILLPVVKTAGIDLIHFGIIMIINLQIGSLTPPVATVAFVTAKIANISFEAQTRALVPFMVLGIVALFVVTYVPALSLWLPAIVRG